MHRGEHCSGSGSIIGTLLVSAVQLVANTVNVVVHVKVSIIQATPLLVRAHYPIMVHAVTYYSRPSHGLHRLQVIWFRVHNLLGLGSGSHYSCHPRRCPLGVSGLEVSTNVGV